MSVAEWYSGTTELDIGLSVDKDIIKITTTSTVITSGNVGIGTTPSYKLHVSDNAAAYTVGISQTNASGYGLWIKPGSDTLSAFTIANAASTTERHFFYGNGNAHLCIGAGNVGIGTTSPLGKLSILLNSMSEVGRCTHSGLVIGNSSVLDEISQILLGAYNNYAPVAITSIVTDAYAYTKADLIFCTRNATSDTAPTERMRITSGGVVQPGADATQDLGTSSIKWHEIFAAHGTINTSDRRVKNSIESSDLGLEFIKSLSPKSFIWNSHSPVKDENGNDKTDEDGNIIYMHNHKRRHYGLIAQDVGDVLNGKDFGGYVHDVLSDTYGLRYDEFISPIIKAIQELSQKVEAMETTLLELQ